MSRSSRVWKFLERYFEALAKARVQSTLLTMGPDWAERYGYSWEMLRGGTDAWPWRKPAAEASEEQEIRRAIYELRQLSDRELRDIGLVRSGIEAAVRNGHPDRDFTLDGREQAA